MSLAATQSVVHSSRFGAALAVQFMQSSPDLETESLASLAARQVGDVRLRNADLHSNFVLLHASRHQVGDDFFPHDAHDSICCCQDQQQSLVQHLLLRTQNYVMEIEEIRRLRLRQWIDNDPVSQGDVEKWCNHYSKLAVEGDGTLSPTYIRQLVPKRGTASRNIGERVARRLERIVGKPKGSLDEEIPNEHTAVADERGAPAGRADAPVGNIAAIDVVQNAVAGVLEAFGLLYEDLVGDVNAARGRIEVALRRPRTTHRDAHIMRFFLDPSGDTMPPSRPTRIQYRKQFHGEIFPDRSTEQEGATERIQERRT